MTPAGDRPRDVETFSRQFLRLVVRFEHRLRADAPHPGDPGVTDTPGLGVLVALDAFGPLRPTTISTILGMTTGGTTKVVDRVEARRLVTRRPGPPEGDRRAVVITMTPEGQRAIAAAEAHLRTIGDDFVRAIDAVVAPGQAWPTSTAVSTGSPAVSALYRFFGVVDPLLIEVVGPAEVLHPSDPRGYLLLLELDHHGTMPLAAIPALVDRSRTTVHRLVGRLHDLGLVSTGRDDRDRRLVHLEPTREGRRIARRIVRQVEDHMPELEPVLVELARTLRPGHDDPPAAPTGRQATST